MTETETGYRMTFEEFESPVMAGLARGFTHLIFHIWEPMTGLPLRRSAAEHVRTTMKLFRLGEFYLNETIKCHENEANFSSGIVGCSLVECFLLLACIRQRDEVLQTKAWKAFAKKQKKRGQSFNHLLLWLDLGSLIPIGKELGWFSEDRKVTENFLTHYFKGDEWAETVRELPEITSSPFEAVSRVNELRNYLHPGRCVRNNVAPEENTSKLSVALAYISFVGILDFHKGENTSHIDLEVPAPLRSLFRHSNS